MTQCKRTVTGKHMFMPETIFNEDQNWYVKCTKCQACGLVDDKKEVKMGKLRKMPWENEKTE